MHTSPVVFGLVWQCFGAAISLPLYYAIHLQWFMRSKTTPVSDLNTARAIPASFVLGAIAPVVVGMLPTWLGPRSRAAIHHQDILAAWQPDPVWVSWIFTTLASLGSWATAGTTSCAEDSYQWIRGSYLLAATSSAAGHLYVIERILTSNDESLSIIRMYVSFLGLRACRSLRHISARAVAIPTVRPHNHRAIELVLGLSARL